MDKSGKIYVKAMNKYNDGYIDKALSLCEKSISLNNANAAALNLKGILYYLKGDLEKAKNMWNINYKRNHDKVSKKYLDDSVRDKEKLHLYVNALELIKKLNISAALGILNQCENSHFNFINVNNYISSCYIKQGEYDSALQYIKEVLKVDKKNTQAIVNKKTLIEFGNLKREINYKKIVVVTISILLIIITLILAKVCMNNIKDFSILSEKKVRNGISGIFKKDKNETKNIEQEQELKSKDKTIKKQTQVAKNFPQQQFTESLKNDNMEQIITYVNVWKDADLEINDRLLLVKGEDLIKKTGISFFYKKGMNDMNDKKYIKAQKYFLYALPYSKGNYLNEHIIYMLAVSYKSVSDFQNALKYYEINLKQYPSGIYTEEVLYNLILINKDINIYKAKGYAQNLIKQYPNSRYNNSIVKEILSS
ncbi:outer membrane protein assembly factor BamD [Clostridium algoriphilum]|uniref:tetratricopeptide repeat protein n=1 Tax=Clostridium algoriphilum TaxID=198347 RepID=UPI001CF3FCC8|nr:tetratricopeptide repeat protein [Clostridium algoriphilum]MCB2295081.1 outer membrane protein assembly factor BamD [Clostridium algoriphilum]